jgi:hypothetical protein
MTPEAQRIAIAEVCGWKRCQPDVLDYRKGEFPMGEAPNGMYQALPDYPNDLNAMHEAEAKVLNHQQWWAYQEQLEKLVKYTLGATASQRAEAFLRTLNLWKD